jgi:hypothetical protein
MVCLPLQLAHGSCHMLRTRPLACILLGDSVPGKQLLATRGQCQGIQIPTFCSDSLGKFMRPYPQHCTKESCRMPHGPEGCNDGAFSVPYCHVGPVLPWAWQLRVVALHVAEVFGPDIDCVQ